MSKFTSQSYSLGLVGLIALLASVWLQAGNILSDIPLEADDGNKYVLYLHGAIIERGDMQPIHPRFGLYDYPAIIKQLAVGNIELITEQREPNTDSVLYAKKVVSQVNGLVKLGVKPKNITVLGFSKGAGITIRVSSLIDNKNLNFAILATCGPWYDSEPDLLQLCLSGHILSIYEETDVAGSCKSLAARGSQVSSFTELAIRTGAEHGAFYLPREEWVGPVLSWIKEGAGSTRGLNARSN